MKPGWYWFCGTVDGTPVPVVEVVRCDDTHEGVVYRAGYSRVYKMHNFKGQWSGPVEKPGEGTTYGAKGPNAFYECRRLLDADGVLCPKCGNNMISHKSGRVTVHRCSKCGVVAYDEFADLVSE